MAATNEKQPTRKQLHAVRFKESVFLGGALSSKNYLEVGQRGLDALDIDYTRRLVLVRAKSADQRGTHDQELEVPFELVHSITYRRVS